MPGSQIYIFPSHARIALVHSGVFWPPMLSEIKGYSSRITFAGLSGPWHINSLCLET